MKDERAVTVIIKLTQNCNLGCKYCFYTKAAGDNHPSAISVHNLQEILRKVAERWNKVYLILHGGEPFLRPLSFLEILIDIQEKLKRERGTEFRNSVQTNGTIFSDSLATFLRKNKISVGISIDGTKDVHDQARPFKKGHHSSFERALNNISRFRESGLRLSAILVATRQVVSESSAIYEQFKKNQLDFKINELVPEMTPSDFVPSPHELGTFYQDMFDLWFYDRHLPTLRIRPLTTIVASFWGVRLNDCTFQSNCSRYLSIETDGSVFVCGRFNHLPEFKMGNILMQSWDDLLATNAIRQFDSRRTRLPNECQQCQWLARCWGGCSACARVTGNSVYDRTIWCDARKMVFSHIQHSLKLITEDKVYEEQTA